MGSEFSTKFTLLNILIFEITDVLYATYIGVLSFTVDLPVFELSFQKITSCENYFPLALKLTVYKLAIEYVAMLVQ